MVIAIVEFQYALHGAQTISQVNDGGVYNDCGCPAWVNAWQQRQNGRSQPHMAQRCGLQVKAKVAGGQMPMAKYVITKQLTKRPEDYPDAKNQPHVQVALRRKAAGARNGVMQVCSTAVQTALPIAAGTLSRDRPWLRQC